MRLALLSRQVLLWCQRISAAWSARLPVHSSITAMPSAKCAGHHTAMQAMVRLLTTAFDLSELILAQAAADATAAEAQQLAPTAGSTPGDQLAVYDPNDPSMYLGEAPPGSPVPDEVGEEAAEEEPSEVPPVDTGPPPRRALQVPLAASMMLQWYHVCQS